MLVRREGVTVAAGRLQDAGHQLCARPHSNSRPPETEETVCELPGGKR